MNIIENIKSDITYNYDLSFFKGESDSGYAKTIETDKEKTILIFNNVEDHIDGNGLVALWLMQGNGTFYYDGKKTEMKLGDIIIFDDNIEHGFESIDICIGMNVSMENRSINDLREIINKSKIKNRKKINI